MCVQSVAHEIFPLVKPSLKHEKEYHKPLMTCGILKAIVQKRKLIDIFKEKKPMKQSSIFLDIKIA